MGESIKIPALFLQSSKKILLLVAELWTNLRLIATTEKNAKAITFSDHFNQSIHILLNLNPANEVCSSFCTFINI